MEPLYIMHLWNIIYYVSQNNILCAKYCFVIFLSVEYSTEKKIYFKRSAAELPSDQTMRRKRGATQFSHVCFHVTSKILGKYHNPVFIIFN